MTGRIDSADGTGGGYRDTQFVVMRGHGLVEVPQAFTGRARGGAGAQPGRVGLAGPLLGLLDLLRAGSVIGGARRARVRG